MSTPEDDAAARAARAAAGAPLMNFVDFTSGLIHGVFQTLVDTSTEQMRAYVDLVTALAGSLSEYQDRTIGNIDVATLKYLNDFIVPEFVDSGSTAAPVLDPAAKTSTTTLNIRRDKVNNLINVYNGVTVSGPPVIVNNVSSPGPPVALTADLTNAGPTSTGTITIQEKDIYAFTSALLTKGVSRSFDELRALLQMGLMKVIPNKGFIETALMFDVTASDTSEHTSTQSDTDVSTRSRSFALNASIAGGKSSRSGSGRNAIASSISASISGAYASSSTNMQVHVKVVNDKSVSTTNVETNITGRVRIDFITDFFPAVPPAPPQAALPTGP